MRQVRLGTFDALRGIAAIAVVLLHVGEVKLGGNVFPRAYLAVDFFFVLSGFVIAYTYEDKLRAGLSVPAFVARRVARLYPMVLLGVALGTIVLASKLVTAPERVDSFARLAASTLCNMVLLPTPFVSASSRGALFLNDQPLWSVGLEMLVNVAWCTTMVRLSSRALMAMVAACLAVFAMLAFATGTTQLGFDWATLPGGLARVGYGFGLGALLYRVRHALVFVRRTDVKLLAAGGLLGIFAVPPTTSVAVDILGVVLVVPLVVALALNGADHPRLDRVLGDISYPLYAIHYPILLLASGLQQKMPRLAGAPILAMTFAALALAPVLALRVYDEPFRRVLAARLAKRARSAEVGSPGMGSPGMGSLKTAASGT